MKSQTGYLVLLVFLTFLWFVGGIAIVLLFSLCLKAYGEAGDSANGLMLLSLLTLVLLPGVCAHTVVHGWRKFLTESHEGILKIVLIPFPVMVGVFLIYAKAWS